MAKLSDAQKEANKAYRKIRDAHYSVRYREYEKARDAAKATVDASEESAANKSANAESERILAERERIRKDFDDRIYALTIERDAEMAKYSNELERIRGERNRTWNARQALEETLMSEVDERYPDMAKAWLSRAGWVPPAQIQKLIDAGEMPESKMGRKG